MKRLGKSMSFKSELHRGFSVAGVPLAVTGTLYVARVNEVSAIQLLLAFLLLLLPWRDYLRWRRGSSEELPLFAMLAFMYWLFYGVPLFLEERVIASVYDAQPNQLSTEVITAALLMALIGIGCLWLGMKSRIGQFFVPRTRLSLQLTPAKLHYIRAVLIIGSLLNLSDLPFSVVGEGGRQFIGIFLSVLPMLAFAILFRNVLRAQSEALDKILVGGFLIVRFVSGLSTGWLGVSASILVVCGAIYLVERRRVPRAALLAVVLFTLFFQVGKEDFRKTYWQQPGEEQAQSHEKGGRIERIAYWVQTSLEKWGAALSDPSGESFRSAMNQSVSRVSLLNQTANVIDQTPSVVPYQNGRLYSYMAVTWVPRFLWPDKPTVNEANQFYQVAYGLTTEENLGNVSIAVGFLAEGFINFGWLGVVGIMFLIGVFFDFYQTTFLGKTSGLLMTGIGLIMLPQFLTIESQLAQYLGGIAQQVVITLLVMLPVIRIRKSNHNVSSRLGHIEKRTAVLSAN